MTGWLLQDPAASSRVAGGRGPSSGAGAGRVLELDGDLVDAERRSQEAADDQAADAVRVAAPDTRAVAVGRALV